VVQTPKELHTKHSFPMLKAAAKPNSVY